MTNKSIKTNQMKFRIAVTNVQRHSGVHTFQIIYKCARSLSVEKKANQVGSIVSSWRLPDKLPP